MTEPRKFSPDCDTDAQTFLEQVVTTMIDRFGYTEEQAVGRVNKIIAHMRVIKGDHIIYHEDYLYWAQAAHYGRRDFWREHGRIRE